MHVRARTEADGDAVSRSRTKTSATVRCDFPKCPGMFTTYSIAARAREQARAVGWTRRRGNSIADPEDANLMIADKTVDICPAHPADLPRPKRQPRKKKAA